MAPLRQVAVIAATTLTLGAAAFAGWYWIGGGPEHHRDGQGPLASLGNSGNQITHAFDQAHGPAWTIGIPLCLAQGSEPAVLDGSVGATSIVGNGMRYLGARVREFIPSEVDTPIGSAEAFPPTFPIVRDALHQVQGFAVTHPCQIRNPDATVPYTELMLGLGAATVTGGGGWIGIDIGYAAGGHHHVVSTAWNILVCGPLVPARYCPTSPTPSAAT
jgi:hypothetical protein